MGTQALLSLLMIVRNERKSIVKTLASTLPHVDRFTILDTGSTDGTQEIVAQLSEEYGVPGRIHEEPFVDFATCRNRCIELANQEATYFLSMDANDELRGGTALNTWCRNYRGKTGPEFHSFLVRVKWNHEIFTMQRLFRSDARCRYKGVVHEYLATEHSATLVVEGVHVFHERHLDEDKSRARWEQDCVLLEEELRRKPDDLRSLFYLGQSYVSVGKYEKAFECYTRRAQLGGQDEETYIALYRRAELCERFLDRPWEEIEEMYMSAHKHTPDRAEPLVRVGLHYANSAKPEVAYRHLRRACDLPIPYHHNMNVDLELYEFGRWDLLGAVAYYVGHLEEGRAALLKALEFPALPAETRRQVQANLAVYEQKLMS